VRVEGLRWLWAPSQVVNLGTNDFCCGRSSNDTHRRRFEDAYVRFVQDIVRTYDKVRRRVDVWVDEGGWRKAELPLMMIPVRCPKPRTRTTPLRTSVGIMTHLPRLRPPLQAHRRPPLPLPLPLPSGSSLRWAP
jgi:hypothetical protein